MPASEENANFRPTWMFDQEVQNFLTAHANDNLQKLALSSHGKTSVPMAFLLHQIESRRRAKTKLPKWFANEKVVYPLTVSLEQASSEETANYKTNLVSGKSLIDLSGGLGVDDYAFVQKFERVVHCEMQEQVHEAAQHNAEQLGISNINFYFGDSLEYFRNSPDTFDCIYVDPARRDANKKKVFLFEDCEPNLPKHLDFLFTKASLILVKASPLIDLKQGINELNHVKEIHVVSLHNDCKEVLFLLEKGFEGEPIIKTVNLPDTSIFEFRLDEELQLESNFSEEVHRYVYEPNSAILKAGAFKSVKKLGVKKLAPNTHLYTSNELIDFPGKRYELVANVPYKLKELKKVLPELSASVNCRNFPDKPDLVKKKLKLKESSEHQVIACRDNRNKSIILLTRPIR